MLSGDVTGDALVVETCARSVRDVILVVSIDLDSGTDFFLVGSIICK
jgi:hypothetical protein